nr:sugar nucleotide-binding protein [Leuconostoc mesenteroides]
MAFDSKQLDITNSVALLSAFEQEQSDVVLHAAAYTRVDLAEDEGREALGEFLNTIERI